MTRRVVPREAFEDPDRVAGGERVSLLGSQCEHCGRAEFPARRHCPACGGVSPEIGLQSTGTLRGFTSVLHPPPGALVEVPYHVGVVELNGAIRVMGLLDDPPDALEVGQAVETVAVNLADDLLTYAFRAV